MDLMTSYGGKGTWDLVPLLRIQPSCSKVARTRRVAWRRGVRVSNGRWKRSRAHSAQMVLSSGIVCGLGDGVNNCLLKLKE